MPHKIAISKSQESQEERGMEGGLDARQFFGHLK